MRSLVWFTQDLRLQDNRALQAAHQHADNFVMHVFFLKDYLTTSAFSAIPEAGKSKKRFLFEALHDLQQQLQHHGHRLLIINGRAHAELPRLLTRHRINSVHRAHLAGLYEKRDWLDLQIQFPMVEFNEHDSYTLFSENLLPFKLSTCPSQFTPFRKTVEKIATRDETDSSHWAKAIDLEHEEFFRIDSASLFSTESDFTGGETAGLIHISSYFETNLPSRYKETRNSLSGFHNSTRFSPWLAQGSVSVIQIIRHLRHYEEHYGSNESTYWIYFELLWREFFFWSSLSDGVSLYRKRGRRKSSPLTTFYPERFAQWMHGTTEWPLVNACMRELAATGFISNRARQIVASCFVNELQLDWRYGAAYFEQQLIDYDVGSNWGNWQYQAGVGADPRGQRHFNIEKQSKTFDPDGSYIALWGGNTNCMHTDLRDASDWPIISPV